jgi:hypothetical protein
MPRFSIAVLLCAALLLSACAEKWEKPGATERDFDAAQSACFSYASARFPPRIRPVQIDNGYTTPVVTQCDNTRHSVSCIQQGGDYVPPTVIGVDDNEDARDADIRSCLYQNGWHPAKD